MDFLDLMFRLNSGDIELTPKNRIIFEWELMKSINLLINRWQEILDWVMRKKRSEELEVVK